MILIAGAGLAGLSAAFHLGDAEYRIIEKEARPGGLCRTERLGPYSFDYGGHLLHFRDPAMEGWVKELLGESLSRHRRRSAVFSGGVFTPYPFQVNTHGLPADVIRDCVLGFIEAWQESGRHSFPPGHFEEWIHRCFGRGFARHFFLPFNRKFFKLDLSELTAEWASWSIPRPELRDVINGALGIQERDFGYNVEFYYPTEGIEALPRALASALYQPVETGVELVGINLRERRARLSTGEELRFQRLIATLPLDRLLALVEDAPAEIRQAGQRLRVLSVVCVNLGAPSPFRLPYHWIYFPEEAFCFHRIGLYSNYMRCSPGRFSLYLEITLPGPCYDPLTAGVVPLMERALEDLKGVPLAKEGEWRADEIMATLIPHGYVVYDRHRSEWLPRLLSWLRERGVELAGRYARWEYATMEDALRQGKEAALAGRT